MIKLYFTDIEKAITFVTNRHNYHHGFEHFAKYMASIGNPQDQFRSIHIAGTNGKGSTTNYLKDILRHSGYKVGTFTSPHLISHLDRIRIDDKWIMADTFLFYLNEYLDDILKFELSMFEIDMLIASLYFKDEKVDIAIIETGLGGRLDSTNVLNYPLVDAIVSIGYDHMDRLGNTLEKIAREKAGIIKKDAKVVIGNMPKYLEDVIKAYAKNNHIFNNNYEFNLDKLIVDGKAYPFNSKALYQRHNMAMALNIVRILSDFKINYDGLDEVLLKSSWAGRFEILDNYLPIIIDGAHNQLGIRALISSLQEYDKEFNIIFAAMKDKEPLKLLEDLKVIAKRIIVTKIDMERCEKLDAYPDMYFKYADFKEAIDFGISLKEPLVICGSLYFISDARKYLLEKANLSKK